jgi:hypothetical protein
MSKIKQIATRQTSLTPSNLAREAHAIDVAECLMRIIHTQYRDMSESEVALWHSFIMWARRSDVAHPGGELPPAGGVALAYE